MKFEFWNKQPRWKKNFLIGVVLVVLGRWFGFIVFGLGLLICAYAGVRWAFGKDRTP